MQISITRALSELKVLQKRFDKEVSQLNIISVQHGLTLMKNSSVKPEDFSEKAKALLASLKESFSQVDFSDLDDTVQDELSEPETIIVDVPSLNDSSMDEISSVSVDSPIDEYEIICINDCSSDSSYTLLKEYQKKYNDYR